MRLKAFLAIISRMVYKSFFVRGKINKKTKTFEIKKIPVTYFRSINIDGVDCMMDFTGAYYCIESSNYHQWTADYRSKIFLYLSGNEGGIYIGH
jgi:hypothetical protein